jgi:hypothetical protein
VSPSGASSAETTWLGSANMALATVSGSRGPSFWWSIEVASSRAVAGGAAKAAASAAAVKPETSRPGRIETSLIGTLPLSGLSDLPVKGGKALTSGPGLDILIDQLKRS